MSFMKKIDRSGPAPASHLDLDGRALQLLLAVHEEGSVTRAALRLGLTQSAVSHGLDRLRVIVGDPLFVKSGRGIVATAQADLLAQRARGLVDELKAFSTAAGFDPATQAGTLTIAANDLQRDLLLPELLRRVRAQAPGLALRVITSGAPDPALLRDRACELVITPRPPEGTDIVQRRLCTDRYRVFFDSGHGKAPTSLKQYLAAEHVTVIYEPRRTLVLDEWLLAQGIARRFVAAVPGFAGLAAFVRGGPWLATAPGLLRGGVMRGLADAAPPFQVPAVTMYMVWHLRHQRDPAHRWLRDEVMAVARLVR